MTAPVRVIRQPIMDQERANLVWDNIRKLAEPLSSEEQEILSTVLQSRPFQKALALAYSIAQSVPLQVVALNLSTSEGVAQAIQLQGHMRGVEQFLMSLISLAMQHEEEESE